MKGLKKGPDVPWLPILVMLPTSCMAEPTHVPTITCWEKPGRVIYKYIAACTCKQARKTPFQPIWFWSGCLTLAAKFWE